MSVISSCNLHACPVGFLHNLICDPWNSTILPAQSISMDWLFYLIIPLSPILWLKESRIRCLNLDIWEVVEKLKRHLQSSHKEPVDCTVVNVIAPLACRIFRTYTLALMIANPIPAQTLEISQNLCIGVHLNEMQSRPIYVESVVCCFRLFHLAASSSDDRWWSRARGCSQLASVFMTHTWCAHPRDVDIALDERGARLSMGGLGPYKESLLSNMPGQGYVWWKS